jgi:RNA polymerase sigma factor (sigma-70 family)
MGLSDTEQLATLIRRLQRGDEAARGLLFEAAEDRLRRLTRKMLKSFPAVHRWEQTDDVSQNACLRLHKALTQLVPESVRHFFNIAAVQIRRELIDLSRHYGGPEGMGAHHATKPKLSETDSGSENDNDPLASSSFDPSRLERWGEFHRQVELLPDEEREIFNLLWYQEMSQAQVAELMGISERTLQRRWQSARLKLFEALNGELPE